MEQARTTFLGAVLKEIACTPNANFDPDDYRRRVVDPVRELRKLDDETRPGELPEDRRREVFGVLRAVLEAKGVDPDERAERLSGVARRFGVDERDPTARRSDIPFERAGGDPRAARVAAG